MTEENKQENFENTETEQQQEADAESSSTDVQQEFSESKRQKLDEDLQRAKENGVSVEEFEKVRKAAAEYSHEAQKYRQEAKAYKELGVEPEKVKELLEQQREAEMRKLEEDRRYDEIVKKIREETDQEKETYRSRLEEMQTRVQKTVYEKDLTSALASEDGIGDLLDGKLRSRTKVVEDGDNYKTVVVDENGAVTDMSVRDLLKEWKNDPVLGHGFKAPKISGSGTSTEGASKAPSNKPGPKQNRSKMSKQDRNTYIRKNGIDEYKKLPF